MDRKKLVYIAGPITGVKNYWEAFELAEEDLQGLGYIPLSPAHLPQELTNSQAMRICFAMIDSADAVLFLADWECSKGARLEANYLDYTDKPVTFYKTRDPRTGGPNPREVVQAWLKHDLEEVFKK